MLLFASQPVYTQTWFIILVSILGSILAGFLLVLLFIFASHQRARRKVKELKNEYSSVHASFTNDCRTMIDRIKTISHNNATYVPIYENDNARYEEISESYDDVASKSLNKLDELLGTKNYKDLGKASDDTKKLLNEYEEKANLLANELHNMLRPEEECNALVVNLREKFRNLRDKHDENQIELASLQDSFDVLFDAITSYFEKINDCLNAADYDGAKKVMPKAEELISEASKVIGELPYLNTLCDKVIPNRITELKNAKEKMESEKYPLQNLKLNENIMEMEKSLAASKKRLQSLSIKGVRETLDGISKKVNEFIQDFEKEKTSKEEFLQKEESLNNSTFQCERQYSTLITKLPEYQKIYFIDKIYLDQIKKIGDMIEDMGRKKRMFDTYATSATPLPYSSLVSQMESLEKQVAVIEKGFLDFDNYLKGLRSDADRAYQYVRDSFVLLKKHEAKLRSANIASFTKVEKPKITKAMNMLKELNDVLKVAPINVSNVNFKWKEADNYIQGLNAEIDKTYKDMVSAENLIVYDNKYRIENNQIQSDLRVVENSFYEGDFTRASSVAVRIYQDSKAVEDSRRQ